MSIPQIIDTILAKIPANVKLVAVSKTKPKEDIIEAYEGGYRIFGENKPQELAQKYNDLPKDIEWHFIGHLQTNKVKYIAPFVQLIHAVDSIKLLKEINKQAEKNNRVISCLLQFHIASEETKFGLTIDEAKELLTSEDFKSLKAIQIAGVMGMATYTNNEVRIRNEFGNLKSIFESLKSDFFIDSPEFKEISMGMSGDYMLAISEGSTIIRVGSTIFGSRY
ncbi:YggS family pyridoxal phosphate enzyme [Labilibaculum manganireducens]|uniref:Pyridoxal phosphate homeostasis protein n=1 Tax=Labilibaculum manganireducens TaxID=1940525 RepID=A0A2N3IED9_9BACT|nr:YggS family pyridoxal phosphate-dependent enzyme [Labilibaculum manganireducens]PKQ68682.1 YggS family pyridoxal phosphate enzyme [Labilibaculum manganireducens]